MPALPPSAPSPAFRMPDAGNGMFSGLLGQLGLQASPEHFDFSQGVENQANRGEITGSMADYLKGENLIDTGFNLPLAAGLAYPYQIGQEVFRDVRDQGISGIGSGISRGAEAAWNNLRGVGAGLFNRMNPSDAGTAGLAAGTIRSPFPPTNTTPTTERMIRALKNPLKVDVPRPTGGGGGLFAGLGGLLSGAAPAAAWGLGLPLGMMWPSKISEEQGIVPESGPLTPQQLFKMRNDAEEIQLRQGGVPVIPEVPEWNPQASIPPDFRVNERSMAALSPSVTYTPPPVAPSGPANLEALRGLIKDDPRVAEKYIGPRGGPPAPTQLMRNLQSRTPVETFADIPRTPWTPPAPVIPDIFVPPPAAAPTPYVEQFEEFTPPRKVEQRQPSQRAPKVVKKKATKAKPKPRRVKQTAVQKALAKPAPRRVKYTPPKPKPAPRRVKYTPPKPKSKTPVTRRKGGKPKVRRVSKAPRRPGGR